jgi:hypothetical protein
MVSYAVPAFERGHMTGIAAPDDLSEWEAAPPAARARGSAELIRRFDSAAAAMAFLARHVGSEQRLAGSAVPGHRLPTGEVRY